MMPTSGSVFSGSISADPNPPIISKFGHNDAFSLGWQSIVLHCPLEQGAVSNPAILCAKIVPVATTDTSNPIQNKPVLGSNIAEFYNATFTYPGITGTFDMNIDNTGVGSYYWNFDITNFVTNQTVVKMIQQYGLKCKLNNIYQ